MTLEFTETSIVAPNLPFMEEGKEVELLEKTMELLGRTGKTEEDRKYCEQVIEEGGTILDILGYTGEARIGTYETNDQDVWKYIGINSSASMEHAAQQSPIIS